MSAKSYASSGPVTIQDAAGANGNGTALGVAGHASAALQVSGTFTATVNFEGTVDGSNWVALQGVNLADGSKASTATATGIFLVPCGGLESVRARISGYASGAVTVSGSAVPGASPGGLADVELSTGDIEVGAVEIKNATDDTRATVGANGLHAEVRAIAAGETHVGEVGGKLSVVGVELTRPANADAYAAKDVISADPTAYLTFANVARVAGGSGYITKVRLMTDQKTNVASYRLHLFHTAPTAIADNSPYLLLYANAANRIGQVDIGPLNTEDPTNSTAAAGINLVDRLPFICVSRDLYVMVETLTAFTPASGQKFYVELTADLN